MSPKRLNYFVDALVILRERPGFIDAPDDETDRERLKAQIEGELLRRGYRASVVVTWGPRNLLVKLVDLQAMPFVPNAGVWLC